MAEAAMVGTQPEDLPERTLYKATGGRKTFFSFVFIILLPFFVSLPFMLNMRIQHGHYESALGLGIMAFAFALLMFLVFVELMFSLRTQIDLGPTAVRMTVATGSGPTPLLFYKTHEIPYSEIHSVETRREIYGGSFAPVLLKASEIVTKDGRTITLGYVSEANVDPAFPYPEIAKQIADRARLPLIDRGSMWRTVRQRLFGRKKKVGSVKEVNTVDEAQIAELNRSHHNVVMALVGALAILVAAGIVEDFATGTPVGQTAGLFGGSSSDTGN